MTKPCTNCPHNRKSRIVPPDGGHKAVWHRCYLLGFPMGYYEMIANCVDYAEYLAWQRENRKKRKEEMKLLVILMALVMLCLILIVVAVVIDSNTLGQYASKGLLISFIGLIVTGVIIGISTPNYEPTALDVYRGKTTLEITYRDSVAIDSTVVYKVK